MTIEGPTFIEDEAPTIPDQGRYLRWTPIVAGGFVATAFTFILVTFGVTIGLGVSSASPTWRDASIALSLLSGLYLILQAIVSFGLGGYIAGRVRGGIDATSGAEREMRDGFHGLAAWALAVLLGAVLAGIVSAAAVNRASSSTTMVNSTVAEPLLSYELDRLLRSPRRPANADISAERAEASRILMTSSSHNGVNGDDRTHLMQQIQALTGLSAGDSERRVDQAIASSKTAITHARRSTIVLAFSVAAATLLGAVSAWAAAVAGGRHRDGAPLPEWMAFADRLEPKRTAVP
ncbi:MULTISPECIES: hypothetical protein [unclassified Bradyrhizobium]|uniref:hypothetical protein n=1 Tax=unclassified Bradyrhizobium TaxID=2631580 RepID=UPI002478669A|nr:MULTISPECIES: hypothetical protein [unclassified Bradyrhizobium]WGR70553.1 hypothetical protein MTX24_35365 [Bradyrhizobium sp. ISRA426]WGR75390.1 hypothetical protein MTX21_20465 [Bradyrhizobium sp. ISRA430]WGR85794.1 hypothetical protein MTX25_35050 [Bradyrhizobium sp. ISRA432]